MNCDGSPAQVLPALSQRPPVPRRGRVVGPAFRKWWQAAFFLGGSGFLAESDIFKTNEQLDALLRGVDARIGPALRKWQDFDDARYYLPTKDEMLTVFNSGGTRSRSYWPEVFDCEDFAYTLKGDFTFHRYQEDPGKTTTPFALGILWGGGGAQGFGRGHVVNIVVTSDAGVWLLDADPLVRGTKKEIMRPADWNRSIDYIVI